MPPRARVRLLVGSLLKSGSTTSAADAEASFSAVRTNASTRSPRPRAPRKPIYNNGFTIGSTPRKGANASDIATPGTALDASTSRLATCHQINTLFRSQPSFADAEELAEEFFKLATTKLQSSCDVDKGVSRTSPTPLSLPLLESVLDALGDSGELAHVPCEVANFSLHAPFRRAMILGEAAEIVLALLCATRVQRDGIGWRRFEKLENQCQGQNNSPEWRDHRFEADSKLLLASVAAGLLMDLVETDGSAKWFPTSLKERITVQLSK